MATIQNTKTNVGEDDRRKKPLYTAAGNVDGTTTIENSMEAPQKTKNRTSICSRNSTPRDILEEFKSGCNKGTCTSMFIAALLTIAKQWIQPRCPTTDE
jgi:hypothetical protein